MNHRSTDFLYSSSNTDFLVELNSTGSFPDETDKTPMVKKSPLNYFTSDSTRARGLFNAIFHFPFSILSVLSDATWKRWELSARTQFWIVNEPSSWNGQHRTKRWTIAIRRQEVTNIMFRLPSINNFVFTQSLVFYLSIYSIFFLSPNRTNEHLRESVLFNSMRDNEKHCW